PAIADIEKTFVERWNDSSRTRNWPFEAIDPDQPEITEPIGTYAPTGMHSVQVLRTYGLGKYSYSWADPSEKGEFSIWASTLNAIKKAESYIYIEDQTFFTLGWPARCDDIFNPSRQVVDVVYQLGKALERGIKVGILVSNKTTRGFYLNVYEKYQRDYSLRYLQNIANQTNPDNFFVGYLHNDNEVIYIHSKMFIADDEFALIGSANIDQRSMTHDSELKLGVVDSANQFAKGLRIRLFKEHLENPSTTEVDLNNYDEAFDYMKSAIQNNQYRLRTYDFYSSEEWKGHAKFMNLIYSPYGGPLNLR
ncbi:MAG: hypothetical protein HKN31_07915, partial [Pricia sp.]|nr:hypothetical protein [Pricia sp.]